MPMKTPALWIAAAAAALGLTAALSMTLLGADRRLFAPGDMTGGHYQIEIACDACHTPFQGVSQEACVQCHGAGLEAGNDSHPRSKFEDPRNADRVALLDARRCVTCHVEHRPERTRAMGVTLAADFCVHCHADIGAERPSHRDLGFETCAGAGCHNYHDNTALYEEFLLKHRDAPPPAATPRLPLRAAPPTAKAPLAAGDRDGSPHAAADPGVVDAWALSAHARGGVNCRDCHQPADAAGARAAWRDRPGPAQCAACHAADAEGFLDGRHGMRLRQGLTPMSPGQARRPMRGDAHDRGLGCTSCHGAHDFDPRRAAVDGCLGCHDDTHSRAYRESPHHALWQAEVAQHAPAGSGVSCASCHLPREIHRDAGRERVTVQHNQNRNLRPNEKMIRGVCLHCHGLAFAIDALADPALIARNFRGRPSRHIESLDMAAQRLHPSDNPRNSP